MEDIILPQLNSLQEKIIYKLRYNSLCTYNQLWEKEGDSSKFAYHIKSLEEKGIVQKTDQGYSLTSKGIKVVDYIFLKSPQPLVIVLVVPKRDDEILLLTRSKEPFFGLQEFLPSKVKHGEHLSEAAKDRLQLKLGLTGDLCYKGLESLKTIEQGEVLMHHLIHIFLADNCKGEAIKGEWHKIDSFNPENPVPHLLAIVDMVLFKGFSISEGIMIKEGRKYGRYIIQRQERFSTQEKEK